MLSPHAYGRIRANAQVFGVDLTEVDELILGKIVRAAKANQWAMVEDIIQGVAA